MHDKHTKRYDNVFFFCVWGKKYIDEFNDITCLSLIENLKKINNKKNFIYIWSTSEDIKYLKKKKKYK